MFQLQLCERWALAPKSEESKSELWRPLFPERTQVSSQNQQEGFLYEILSRPCPNPVILMQQYNGLDP